MNQPIQERAFNFASDLIKFSRKADYRDEATRIVMRQLLRSGTSIGANLEEASAGQSKPDFIFKCTIASKEARETYYWLRLIKNTGLIKSEKLDGLIEEARQIVAVLTAIVKKAGQSPNRQKNSL
jgi:four helix bundle protein